MGDAASTAREMIDCINSGDMARYRALLHPDYTYTGGDGQTERGPDAGVAIVEMYRNGFSDLKIDIQHVHAAGDTAIVEFIGGGTHSGELMGIAASGRKVAQPVISVLEIRDGKIYAEREYFDSGHLWRQLSGTPAAATA